MFRSGAPRGLDEVRVSPLFVAETALDVAVQIYEQAQKHAARTFVELRGDAVAVPGGNLLEVGLAKEQVARRAAFVAAPLNVGLLFVRDDDD